MASTRHRILVSFTHDEMEQVRADAARYQLHMSEMMRRMVLGQRLPDTSSFEAAQGIHKLLQVNADQARLGNLLLLALEKSDGKWPMESVAEINRLIEQIRAGQDALKQQVRLIHAQLHPKRGGQ